MSDPFSTHCPHCGVQGDYEVETLSDGSFSSVMTWGFPCDCERKHYLKEKARADQCVNACAGMPDPAAEIAALRARVAGMESAFRPLVDACKKDFCSPATETGELRCTGSVGGGTNGEMAVTFEMIREASAALKGPQ